MKFYYNEKYSNKLKTRLRVEELKPNVFPNYIISTCQFAES